MHSTEKMITHFEKRTNKHIALFEKYHSLFREAYKGYEKSIGHDASKLDHNGVERTPYILISWDYYCKSKKIPFELSESERELTNQATLYHIITNPHHPEYHDPNFNSTMLNREDRDEVPEEMVDARTMPLENIAEMVCDWMAMSEEKGTEPYEWANKNINIRWKFTKKQVQFIAEILSEVWGK